MILNRDKALITIRNIIKTRIADINAIYRRGPSQHFYHRAIELRQRFPDVLTFLENDTCVEILYATLVAWDMNSRGAKMKDFCDFKSNLQKNRVAFEACEAASFTFSWENRTQMLDLLCTLYDGLALMETDGRLVSNSKCLHFIFPHFCLPMDGRNTLNKLYGSTHAPKTRFKEILDFSYDILQQLENPKQYLDNQWNRFETKLVDNAIILM